MKVIKNSRGESNLKTLVWLIIIVSGLYAAYKFAPPYVSFYMLKVDVEEEAKNAHMYNDAALANRILNKAGSWSISLGSDNIEIDRMRTSISVSVHYTETITFFGRYSKTIEYDIDVEKPLKETGRTMY